MTHIVLPEMISIRDDIPDVSSQAEPSSPIGQRCCPNLFARCQIFGPETRFVRYIYGGIGEFLDHGIRNFGGYVGINPVISLISINYISQRGEGTYLCQFISYLNGDRQNRPFYAELST